MSGAPLMSAVRSSPERPDLQALCAAGGTHSRQRGAAADPNGYLPDILLVRQEPAVGCHHAPEAPAEGLRLPVGIYSGRHVVWRSGCVHSLSVVSVSPRRCTTCPLRPPMPRCSFGCGWPESTRWTAISWDG